METDQLAPQQRFSKKQRTELTFQAPVRKEELTMTISQRFSKQHQNLSMQQQRPRQSFDLTANGLERRVDYGGKKLQVPRDESHQRTMNANLPRFVMTNKKRGGGQDLKQY